MKITHMIGEDLPRGARSAPHVEVSTQTPEGRRGLHVSIYVMEQDGAGGETRQELFAVSATQANYDALRLILDDLKKWTQTISHAVPQTVEKMLRMLLDS